MPVCQGCGGSYDDKFKFCPYCGRAKPEHLQRRQETKYKYIGVFTDAEDESNDPELTASVERGQLLLDAISKRIAERANTLRVDAISSTEH